MLLVRVVHAVYYILHIFWSLHPQTLEYRESSVMQMRGGGGGGTRRCFTGLQLTIIRVTEGTYRATRATRGYEGGGGSCSHCSAPQSPGGSRYRAPRRSHRPPPARGRTCTSAHAVHTLSYTVVPFECLLRISIESLLYINCITSPNQGDSAPW